MLVYTERLLTLSENNGNLTDFLAVVSPTPNSDTLTSFPPPTSFAKTNRMRVNAAHPANLLENKQYIHNIALPLVPPFATIVVKL